MNRKNALVALALIIVLIALPTITVPVNATCLTTEEYKHGPREDELSMNFYSNVETAYVALKAGAIDMVMYDITYEQYLDAIEDPEIQLVSVDDMGMYEVDINNNYTIPSFPGIRNPCNEVSFRQAMACLFDKDYVVSTCCGGFAARIDIPVAAPVDVSWVNTSVVDEHGGVYYGNYPYKYDPWRAQQYLDDNGFVVGTTPNPYYDPTYAWSQEYLRTYPAGWDGKAGDLDPIVACIRNDDARRLCMGRFLADNMEKSGIPLTRLEKSMAGHYGKVMGSFDYHWYTGGWSLGRFPLAQYGCYHGDFWYPWGANYVTGVDKNGNRNYPDLDKVLDELYYCPDMAASMAASQDCQYYLVNKYCICIWAFGAKSYWAYRNLLGVTNMDGYSLDNEYTFMNMKTVDGTRPACGIITPPYQQNVLMSSWFYDRQVMDRYYDASAGISLAPYALARDQPWVIQDWTPTTWCNPETIEAEIDFYVENTNATTPGIIELHPPDGKEAYEIEYVKVHTPECTTRDLTRGTEWDHAGTWCDPDNEVAIFIDLPSDTEIWISYKCVQVCTKVIVWFRENVKWVAPVTGAVVGNFTAHDYAFSNWVIAAYTKAWTHDGTEDIHHIKIIDDYCCEVYMESESYWLQYCGNYVVNKALWQDKFCMINTTTVVLDRDYVACEKLPLRPYISPGVGPGKGAGQILQMVDCTLDAESLEEDLHYEIVMLDDDHTHFHWLRNASAGQSLTIIYWTFDPAKDCDGYWPGELPWSQIAVGIGTHYLVDYVGGAGGYASLKANRNFWLETPVPDPKGTPPPDPCNPLPGEVDWIWEWGPRDTDRPLGGPRCGTYVVDISDVVLCTVAFRSRGNVPVEGELDPRWFAGADNAYPPCYIDIGDVVTITGRYRRKFGGWSKCICKI